MKKIVYVKSINGEYFDDCTQLGERFHNTLEECRIDENFYSAICAAEEDSIYEDVFDPDKIANLFYKDILGFKFKLKDKIAFASYVSTSYPHTLFSKDEFGDAGIIFITEKEPLVVMPFDFTVVREVAIKSAKSFKRNFVFKSVGEMISRYRTHKNAVNKLISLFKKYGYTEDFKRCISALRNIHGNTEVIFKGKTKITPIALFNSHDNFRDTLEPIAGSLSIYKNPLDCPEIKK